MKKKDSIAWQLAVRICRRKYACKRAVALSDCGKKVQFQSLIRGNTWWCGIDELAMMARGNK